MCEVAHSLRRLHGEIQKGREGSHSPVQHTGWMEKDTGGAYDYGPILQSGNADSNRKTAVGKYQSQQHATYTYC